MNLIYKIIFVFIITVSLNENLFADNYVYGVINFPPFSVVKNNNEYGGLIVDMIKTLDHAKIKYSVSTLPLKRLYKGLVSGKVSIFIGIRSGKLDKYVIYSRKAISTIDLRVFSTGTIPPPESIHELKNKKVIAIRGYSYGTLGEFLNDPSNGISLEMTSEHETGLKMLKANRADYLIDYKLPVELSCEKVFPGGKGLKSRSLNKMKMFFLVSKKAENYKLLMKKVSESFIYLRDKGELKSVKSFPTDESFD